MLAGKVGPEIRERERERERREREREDETVFRRWRYEINVY
jgi:hypothetical protein